MGLLFSILGNSFYNLPFRDSKRIHSHEKKVRETGKKEAGKKRRTPLKRGQKWGKEGEKWEFPPPWEKRKNTKENPCKTRVFLAKAPISQYDCSD